MPDDPSYAAEFTLAATAILSAGVLFWLFVKHIDGRPLLVREPCRSVPWSIVAPAAMLGPTLLALVLNIVAQPADEDLSSQAARAASVMVDVGGGGPIPLVAARIAAAAVEAAAEDLPAYSANGVWLGAGTYIALALACFLLLIVAFHATPADLGLPRTMRQLTRDVVIGATTFVAVVLPVHLVQFFLATLLDAQQMHPLMERIVLEPSTNMIAAATVAAVIAAPLFEETAFRLVFQGWLERREDAAILRRRAAPTLDAQASSETPLAPPLPLEAASPASAVTPALLRDVPPGWRPILISAAMFSAAHIGQGVAPASLLILGFALGYIYQRTHRIVPSIVCHMLFNSFSLALFWWTLPIHN